MGTSDAISGTLPRSDRAASPRFRAKPGGLRRRGTAVVAALAAYLAFMGALVVLQTAATERALDSIDALGATASALGAWALDTLRSPAPEPAPDRTARRQSAALDDAIARASLPEPLHADVSAARSRAGRLDEAAGADPGSEPGADRNRQARREEAARALRAAADQLHVEAERRTAGLRERARRDAFVLIFVGLVGIVVLGVAIFRFLARIAADLTAVRLRAVAIVDGDVAPPAAPLDEVGQLATAIEELARALDRRERDLEIERRQRFHDEKMAAIGSLAAGVLTEIGNPIAAIDGFARAMKDAGAASGTAALAACRPEAILEQTARLMIVARQIEEFTAPQPSQRQLVDINAVVETALGLLRYDETMRAIRVEIALDRQLPAVPGTTDRLVQLVMNLCGNAADALRDRPRGTAVLRIATARTPDGVALSIQDNGAGMGEYVRTRAFEPFFSTKPRGQGTGLGLPLCRSIVEDHGGRIALDSAPGRGTRVTIALPLAAADAGSPRA